MEQPTNDIQAITERLNRLERQNRRLRRAVLALPLVALMIGAQAADFRDVRAKTLRADSIVVQTDGNRAHAVIGTDRNGAFLVLHDSAGRPRLRAAANADDGPGVFLYDERNVQRIAVRMSEKHGPIVRLANADDTSLLNFAQNRDTGFGSVEVYDGRGKFIGGIGGK